MPKVTDAKEALQKLVEEVKLYRGVVGPVVDTLKGPEARPGYAAFFSSDPYVASSYGNPPDLSSNFAPEGAVFPLRARPKKIIEFPVKASKWGTGNDFDKFAFDRAAQALKPGEALVARQVYDAGPRASKETDPEGRFSYPSDVWALGPEVDTTPLHKAKGGKISSALDAATQYVKNKLPQTGFFSTLDELIGAAPFEKAPIDQWKNYLKPGRTFEREGVRFPLKQEELDYSWPTGLDDQWAEIWDNPSLSKDELRTRIRRVRPDLALRMGLEDPTGRASMASLVAKRFPEEFDSERTPPDVTTEKYSDWAHSAPQGNYEESATRSTDFGPTDDMQHFGNDVISHSRTTIQPTSENGEQIDEIEGSPIYRAKLMRLIEEIQSDRHQKAAERPTPEDWAITNPFEAGNNVPPPRRGYRTPADEENSRRLYELENKLRDHRFDLSPDDWLATRQEQIARASDEELARKRVPDTPFKDPADYGLLELKMQMLNAAKQGQDYLGLVRGKDVSDRFSQGAEEAAGTSHIYDKVYPSVMRKLAAQYGTEVRDVGTNLKSSVDVATPAMRDLDHETISDVISGSRDMADDSSDHEEYKAAISHLLDVTKELEQYGPETAHTVRQSIESLRNAYQKIVANPEDDHSELGALLDRHWDAT